MPDAQNPLSADKSIARPEEDLLGYASFAKHLAQSISKMSPAEGFVLSVYGPWGSGKTSLLNLTKYFLAQSPEQERPLVVDFNPWWFSGHEDLTRRFFDQLEATLANKWKSKLSTLRGHLADFADVVSETSLPYTGVAKSVSKVARPSPKDVPELKKKVAEELLKQKKRILVIIDDIDRLTAEEIRQLFRVIKAVADFPNLVYLLAFDKEVVVSALKGSLGISGEDFLEKIIQVPLEIPVIDKLSLRKMLSSKLDTILAGTPETIFNQTHWANVYLEGLDHFIITPRDIARLINTLALTYPAVKGEVNPVDFIAIHTLQVFSPLTYDVIRKNRDMFAGHSDYNFSDPTTRTMRPFHEFWLETVPLTDKEAIKKLLLRLFPKLEAAWGGNTIYGANWLSTWRKELRICSPDIFPTYFRLVVPEGDISQTEMQAILALASDEDAFGAMLVELSTQKHPSGMSRVRMFLERMQDFTGKDIPVQHIPTILNALFKVGDAIIQVEDKEVSLFATGNNIRLTRILWQLLKRLDNSPRYAALKAAIEAGHALTLMMEIVVTIGQQQGKYAERQADPENEWLLTAIQLAELEELCLRKIREAAKKHTLFEAPYVLQILNFYRELAGDEEVKKYVQGFIKTKHGLVTFLEKSLQTIVSQSASDVVAKKRYSLDPAWFTPFVEPDEVFNRIQGLGNYKLTDHQQTAIRQFLREYEIRKQGKDPNFIYWDD